MFRRICSTTLLVVMFCWFVPALAQDVPPPPPQEIADPALASGVASVIGRWVTDPVIMSAIAAGLIALIMAVRKIIAVVIRAKGQAIEDAAKASSDAADDAPAHAKHEALDKIADIVEGKK